MSDPSETPRERTVPASPPSRGLIRDLLLAAAGGLAVLILGLLAVSLGWIDGRRERTSPSADAARPVAYFQPPPPSAIPDGPDGDAIRRGEALFMNTPANAAAFTGNSLSCVNCHLDGGRRANASPMWSAWGLYPMFRAKNGRINTMEDRIMGCFTFSMNAQASSSGGPPPAGHDVYRDLQAYMHFLATAAPSGVEMPGGGYPKVAQPAQGFDPVRGARVFAANCALCHGEDGQGRVNANGQPVFPPLWGPQSYNWGAGMARINTAAAFIKTNMPLGQTGRLSDQEAWDVAAFINSHERPKDPRQTGSVEDNARRNHTGGKTYYGQVVNGRLLGGGVR
ncbi:MAG: c-type cytochrome [Caulobacter sp.]|nr:c-type cytochrome [Caulobacter sp.]